MKTIFDWLESRGIPYNNKKLISQALMHSSYVNEHKAHQVDNERLEYMGDAVLQLWTAHRLFNLTPPLDEGKMTVLRAQLVREETLADFSRKLDLAQYVMLGFGEEKTGGRDRDSILADFFEAFLGALYLDQGMKSVDVILNEVMIPAIYAPKGEKVIDYKTKLQEVIQAESRKTLHYEVIQMHGPINQPEFEVAVYLDDIVLGKGKGLSKKKAEQMSAKEAFEKMAK